MAWDIHLLNTSILVTKTPLTTISCLLHKYAGRKHTSQSLISDVKDRMLRVVREIVDDLFLGLKQFLNVLIGRLEL